MEGNAGRFVDWLSDSGRRHINPTAGITHGAERNQDEMIPLGQAHLERGTRVLLHRGLIHRDVVFNPLIFSPLSLAGGAGGAAPQRSVHG